MTKALAILFAIVLGALVPDLAQALPALPWIIGCLLFIAFAGMPQGTSRPTGLHLRLIVTAWAIGALACAALWPVDHTLAIGALLTGAAPTATAAPVIVAALGGNAAFAAIAVLGSNLLACLAFPALLALLQGSDAPASPGILFARVAPVVLVPWILARLLAHLRPTWAVATGAQMPRSFALWLLGLLIISASAMTHVRQAGPAALVGPAAVAAGLCFTSFSLGRWLGRPGRSTEVGQSLGQKNTALATWTALACAGPAAALTPVCYILAHNVWNAVQLTRQAQDRRLRKSA